MDKKDWEEILHLIQVQKNIQCHVIDESDYGSMTYFKAQGCYNAYETIEQFIVGRLGIK